MAGLILAATTLTTAAAPATTPETEAAFFTRALETAREIAARAEAECHVLSLYSDLRGPEFDRGTQLAAVMTVPNPAAVDGRPWTAKASAKLFLGLVGTTGVDIATYDDELRFAPLPAPDAQLRLRPGAMIRNKCLHWTDGTSYAILQYPVRLGLSPFPDLWRETTNAVAGRIPTGPAPDATASPPGDLEAEGVRLLPALAESLSAEQGAKIWFCRFSPRTPFFDGLLLHPGSGLPSRSKNPEWTMRLVAPAPTSAARPERVIADLFYGRSSAHPFSPEDYHWGQRIPPESLRTWTDGTRYLVLHPHRLPEDENPVWDRIFEIAKATLAP